MTNEEKCKHYDKENGWCKKLSDWSDPMPHVVYCPKSPCEYAEPIEQPMTDNELKPCPFCGNRIRIVVCDDEGCVRDDDYENDPWSGLAYMLYHDIEDDPKQECPIAGHIGDGVMGVYSYDTREEAIEAWNRRATDDR